MRLEEYVSQLMYRYQCVIIPGFGAFISENKPARLNEETHTFYPPYKAISFNPHLTNNDGLLTNTVAIVEKVSFTEAANVIEKTVTKWHKKLVNSNKLALENIGAFTKNNEGNLVFEPYLYTNYLAESFGLTSFISPKVKRERSSIVESIKVHEAEPIVIDQPAIESFTTKEKEPQPALKVASVKKPIVVKVPKSTKVQKSRVVAKVVTSSSTDTTKVVALHKPRISSLVKYAAAIFVGSTILGGAGIKIHNDNVVHETALMEKAVTNRVNSKIQQATFTLNIPQVPLPLPIKIEKAPYHVVANSFTNFNNAKTELEILEIAGFESKILPANDKGLYTVIYKSFSNQDEAKEFLVRIQKYYNPNAWLLTKEL